MGLNMSDFETVIKHGNLLLFRISTLSVFSDLFKLLES
jgi:hypothetical protein